MGIKRGTTKKSKTKKFKYDSKLSSILILTLMGILIADEINPLPDDFTTTVVAFIFLTVINIGLFRTMGLNKTLKRTPNIRFWNLKQKAIFSLYIFITMIMIAQILNPFAFITFLIIFGFIFIALRTKNKSINTILQSLTSNRTSLVHTDITLVDKMDGKEFERYLAKLYEGLGFFTELTSHTDYGIDIIITKYNIRTGIQAKCYGEGRSVGVDAINQVCGGAGVHTVQKKMVITNRNFTKQAYVSANANDIKLVDRDGLKILIMDYYQAIEGKSIFNFPPFFKIRKQG